MAIGHLVLCLCRPKYGMFRASLVLFFLFIVQLYIFLSHSCHNFVFVISLLQFLYDYGVCVFGCVGEVCVCRVYVCEVSVWVWVCVDECLWVCVGACEGVCGRGLWILKKRCSSFKSDANFPLLYLSCHLGELVTEVIMFGMSMCLEV